MDLFGSFALVLAFVYAVYAFVGGIAAILARHPLLVKSTRQAGIASCCLIFLATFSLEYLFFSDNFSIAYVVSHSNRDLSTFYKIAALWSGQEASLLFWSFLLAIYVFSVLTYRNKNGELMPYVGVVMAGVQIFFLTLNNFVASPFKALATPAANGALEYVARADGNGLTPLLQYPEMVIHPPNLYSGYTGFTIPFAFALGALLARYPGEKWIHLTRKWTMIAWMFQSCGIMLGAHWAYAVLGWGGYWGLDPVENASSPQAPALVFDRRGAAAGVAENLDRELEAQFRMAAGDRAVCRCGCVRPGIPRIVFADLPHFAHLRRIHDRAGILSRG